MELWLRFPGAENLEWDKRIQVSSQEEWSQLVMEHQPLSSILWPEEPLFPVIPTSPAPYFQRRHPHEKNYKNIPERNHSYFRAAQKLAERLKKTITGGKILVYAPLRGALPIWKAVSQFLNGLDVQVYYPVTSSFVFYPEEFKIRNPKGKPGSGLFTHVLELKRLQPFWESYDFLLYIDEIVSGGMMVRYLKAMAGLNVFRHIKIIAAGLADDFGLRSQLKRNQIQSLQKQGIIEDFLWEGCECLITQDQKFLLGIHYVDYHSGLNIIPVLTPDLKEYPEKTNFYKAVFKSAISFASGGQNPF